MGFGVTYILFFPAPESTLTMFLSLNNKTIPTVWCCTNNVHHRTYLLRALCTIHILLHLVVTLYKCLPHLAVFSPTLHVFSCKWQFSLLLSAVFLDLWYCLFFHVFQQPSEAVTEQLDLYWGSISLLIKAWTRLFTAIWVALLHLSLSSYSNRI